MGNAFKFLSVIIRITNSVGVDYSMAWIGQHGKVDLSFAIRGDLFRKLLALRRTVNADCVDANLAFTFDE